ncbi:Leucine Rich Repeat [Seminavis robusta]|uniref:Leucine Rich Repeat n=1 Tax=Seminavis robusta TaxID=568900 RepID=A0A9N8E3J5_9STRA|nr:Leucine Rich Repeat [Seminavis robusta]|eukprot:Sro623_g177150.1 Leucine Rich Repeat (847) ;mRNA; r:28292-31286
MEKEASANQAPQEATLPTGTTPVRSQRLSVDTEEELEAAENSPAVQALMDFDIDEMEAKEKALDSRVGNSTPGAHPAQPPSSLMNVDAEREAALASAGVQSVLPEYQEKQKKLLETVSERSLLCQEPSLASGQAGTAEESGSYQIAVGDVQMLEDKLVDMAHSGNGATLVRAGNAVGYNEQSVNDVRMLEDKIVDMANRGKGARLVQYENADSDVEILEQRILEMARRESEALPGAYANGPPQQQQQQPQQPDQTEQELLASAFAAAPEGARHMDSSTGSFQSEESSSQGLVEAKPVREESLLRIPEAIPSDSVRSRRQKLLDEDKRFRRWTAAAVAGFCLIFMTLIVIVAVAVPPRNGAETTEVPTESPAIGPPSVALVANTSYVINLPDYTIEALMDQNSSQSKAYGWLEADPMLEEYSKEKLLQRMALATFFFATSGESWTINEDWLSYDVDECSWFSKYNISGATGGTADLLGWIIVDQFHGPDVCDNKGSYLQLVLPHNGLTSTSNLPKEITLLSNLKRLDYLFCADMALTSTLPTELGKMVNMKEMYIGKVDMTGPIPSEISQMSHLSALDLSRAGLTGTLPIGIGNLTFLKYLHLNKNSISGTLPTEVGLLTAMESLILNHNQLSGTIPSEIGNLPSFRDLVFETNQITGAVPSEIGQLSNLEIMALGDLLITGTIPLEVWLLPSLWFFGISQNNVEGSIPTEIGLASMDLLYIYDNAWSGGIPSEIGLHTGLLELSIERSTLSGTLPSEMALLSNLQYVWMHDTPLSGSFPWTPGNETQMIWMWLNGTMLEGEIPDKYCSIEWLVFDCPDMCGCDCPCPTVNPNATATLLATNDTDSR